MKQFFLFYYWVPQRFKKTYRSLSSILTHKTNSESEILLINSSRNSSLQQISNNQGKVTFRGILLLMDTKLFWWNRCICRSKSGLLCAFESSVKCNFGLCTEKSNELNEVVITKAQLQKLIVGCWGFFWTKGSRNSRNP
jgi:hypothetical protein